MLLCTGANDKIVVTLGSAVTCESHASFADYDGTDVTPGRRNIEHAAASAFDAVLAPGASIHRNVKLYILSNVHATTSTLVTIEHTDGTTVIVLYKCTLLAGETLSFVEGAGWTHFDSNGLPKLPAQNLPLYNAATAAQGPGFASDTYVLGSNLLINGRTKVGTLLRWRIYMSKTAASTAVTATIIRFGTAGAIGDTARVTMAGPAQTAVVDEAVLIVTATVRTAGASGIVQGGQHLMHSAAVAAGFGEMSDAITSGAFDLTVAGLQVGLSLNGSTAAAWTVTQVQAVAENLA